MGLFKRKEPKVTCTLCGKDAGKDFAPLMFSGTDPDTGADYEMEYARVCKACADELDRIEREKPIEADDEEPEEDDEESEWEDVGDFFERTRRT